MAGGDAVDEVVGDADLKRTFREHVGRFARDLDERETKILYERMLADDPKTLQQLGDGFGLTRERVRQIEAQILRRLRAYLEEHLVDFELYAPEE